jgi:hypothetical protein
VALGSLSSPVLPAVRGFVDSPVFLAIIDPMETTIKTIERSQAIPPELMASLQEAADRAARGVRDPESMRLACERMDRMREETYRKHGLLDIGGPAVRELRDA